MKRLRETREEHEQFAVALLDAYGPLPESEARARRVARALDAHEEGALGERSAARSSSRMRPALAVAALAVLLLAGIAVAERYARRESSLGPAIQKGLPAAARSATENTAALPPRATTAAAPSAPVLPATRAAAESHPASVAPPATAPAPTVAPMVAAAPTGPLRLGHAPSMRTPAAAAPAALTTTTSPSPAAPRPTAATEKEAARSVAVGTTGAGASAGAAPAPVKTPLDDEDERTALGEVAERIAGGRAAGSSIGGAQAEHTRLLVRAVGLLRGSGDAGRAASLIAEYLSGNPEGAFVEEARALAIEAAVRAHGDEAARAGEYLSRYPMGRYARFAERVRARRP